MNFNINEYIDKNIFDKFNNFFDKNDNILEIGAGYGEYTFFISKYVKQITALDIDKSKLEQLDVKVRSLKINNIITENSDALKFNSINKFDKIVIFQSISYIKPHDLINIIIKNLKIGGSIFILDLTKSFFFTNRRKIKYLFFPKIPKAENYSRSDLAKIKIKFKKSKLFYFGNFIFFLPIFFFLPKFYRFKIYKKFDNLKFFKKLSFKYLLISEDFFKN